MIIFCFTCIIVSIIICAIYKKINSKNYFDLKNSHAVITGGSSGIGLAIAAELLKKGTNVTLIGRDKDKLKDAKDKLSQCNQSNSKINTVPLDVCASYIELNQNLKECENLFGPIDILINSAGFSVSGTFEDIDISDFKRLMDVNYLGSVQCTKAILPGMKQRRRGAIVFVSSQAGQLGIFGFSAYSASKFALRGLAEALQMEVAAYNISICVAYPPDTYTPGYDEEMKSKPLETKLISESSGVFKADYVAKKIINSIIDGSFTCSVGMDGLMLSTLSSSMTPASFPSALFQILSMGVFRIIGLLYLQYFYNIVQKCHKQNKS